MIYTILLRLKWQMIFGFRTGLIAFLRHLKEDDLRPKNKIDDLCQYLEKHREHIPPYALRAELGLRNSSNRVEKANDLCGSEK